MWQAWVTAIVGIWIAIVPYLNLDGGTMKMVLIISGIVLVVLGIWDAMSISSKCQSMQN